MSELRERTTRSTRPVPDEVVLDRPDAGRTAGRVRVLGVIAVIVVGAVHLEQYVGAHYSSIPTIGVLFVLNFAAAMLIGAGLLVPAVRMDVLLAVAGIGLAATSFVFLFVSESRPLFGFREDGFRPAIIVALAAEAAAVALLGAFVALRARAARSAS